jgi:predicted tellurium resistance membrane protein TerC
VSDLISLNSLIAYLTLTALELILGVDNIIFISILSSRLPNELQQKSRVIGLSLAILTRIALLLSISWVVSLTNPLFNILEMPISGRSIILIFGGLFLIAKSTHEIHQKFDDKVNEEKGLKKHPSFVNVIIQILILDMVFSLDSVITAVGMVSNVNIMIAAVITSTIVMIFSATSISHFVEKHPTIKVLALSFLILIGVTLIAEGLNQHISKSYIYFAMGFSLIVEVINIQLSKKTIKHT